MHGIAADARRAAATSRVGEVAAACAAIRSASAREELRGKRDLAPVLAELDDDPLGLRREPRQRLEMAFDDGQPEDALLASRPAASIHAIIVPTD